MYMITVPPTGHTLMDSPNSPSLLPLPQHHKPLLGISQGRNKRNGVPRAHTARSEGRGWTAGNQVWRGHTPASSGR